MDIWWNVVKIYMDKVLAHTHVEKKHTLWFSTKSSKSTNLPVAEMARGPQHVSEAKNGRKSMNLRKIMLSMEYPLVTSGAPWYPYDIVILNLKRMSEWSSLLVSKFTLYISHKVDMAVHRVTSPKVNNTIKESIMGFPTSSNTHGNGAPVLDNVKWAFTLSKGWQRLYSSSTDAAEYIHGTELLTKLQVREGRYFGLYKILWDEDFLFGCYHSMRSKPGNMTSGTDEETIDGISAERIREWCEEASQRMEKIKMRPVKRVWKKMVKWDL